MFKPPFTTINVIAVLLICSILIVFFCYNYYLAVDFPYMDDFMLIVFVHEFIDKPFEPITFVNKLFQSANSHKLVIPRLIALLDYAVYGCLNFKKYQVLVTLNIFVVLYLLYRQFKKLSLSIWYFIPILLWLLQPQYYDITLFGLNGLQHTFVILFTTLSITVIHANKPFALPIALFLCFLSTFSHGNGFFAYTAIVFYLLVQQRFRAILYTVICMAISLAIFLYKTNDSGVVVFPENVGSFLTLLFGFIGALFIQSATYGTQIAVCVGLLVTLFLVGVCGVTLVKKWEKDNNHVTPELFWLSLFVFIFSTAFVITFLRSQSGVITSSRFQIYSPLFLTIAYVVVLYWVPYLRNRIFLAVCLGGSLLINWHSFYYHTDTVVRRNTQFLADIYNWQNYSTMFSVGRNYLDYSNYFLQPAYNDRMVLVNAPITTPHEIEQLISEGTAVPSITTDLSISINVDSTAFSPLKLMLIRETSTPASPALGTKRFLVVKSVDKDEYLLLTAVPSRNKIGNFFRLQQYYQDGIWLQLREGNLLPGFYELFVLDINSNGEKYLFKIENEQLYISEQGKIGKQVVDSTLTE